MDVTLLRTILKLYTYVFTKKLKKDFSDFTILLTVQPQLSRGQLTSCFLYPVYVYIQCIYIYIYIYIYMYVDIVFVCFVNVEFIELLYVVTQREREYSN